MSKIVIVGAGRVGLSMAEILCAEDNDVTLIDNDENVLDGLQDRMDIRTVHGMGCHPSVLRKADCADAEILLAVTNQDEINMVACHVGKQLFNVPTKIARIRSQDYISDQELFRNDCIPIDVIISPEQIVTNSILHLIEYPGALQIVDFAEQRIQLAVLRAHRGTHLVGKSIKTLRDHLPSIDCRMVAIFRNEKPFIPDGDTIIQDEDVVFFIAARENIKQVMKELRIIEKPGKNIIISGAGNIGLNLTQKLLDRNYNVKVIENNHRRATLVSQQVDAGIVLYGEAGDRELLLQENIANCEIYCAVTNSDAANILSAMLAKNLGANRVFALVNRPEYVGLLHTRTIDIALSPRDATVGSLLAHVRRGDMVAVHSLHHGAAEAIEVIAHGDRSTSKVVGKQVADLDLPSGTAIGAILRQEEVIIAHNNSIIQAEDHVIVLTIDKSKIHDVERLFQVSFLY